MMRLFIAFPLQSEVTEELGKIIFVLKQKGGRVKWVVPKNVHLTARFLGDTEDDLVGGIATRIDAIAEKHQPVESTVDRLGAFPSLTRPRVIWAGLRDNTEILAKVAGQVELSVRELRFKKEPRRFKPHLTLGRVKDPAGLSNLTKYLQEHAIEEIHVVFDRLTLFKSTLTPQGPIYDRLHEAMLGCK